MQVRNVDVSGLMSRPVARVRSSTHFGLITPPMWHGARVPGWPAQTCGGAAAGCSGLAPMIAAERLSWPNSIASFRTAARARTSTVPSARNRDAKRSADAAATRSPELRIIGFEESDVGRSPRIAANFRAKFHASSMPVLAPKPPRVGGSWCAASQRGPSGWNYTSRQTRS